MMFFKVELQKELDVTLGFINTDIDGRFVKIRTEETNLGNQGKNLQDF